MISSMLGWAWSLYAVSFGRTKIWSLSGCPFEVPFSNNSESSSTVNEFIRILQKSLSNSSISSCEENMSGAVGFISLSWSWNTWAGDIVRKLPPIQQQLEVVADEWDSIQSFRLLSLLTLSLLKAIELFVSTTWLSSFLSLFISFRYLSQATPPAAADILCIVGWVSGSEKVDRRELKL